jgi:uncharacterized protein YdeI (YjbR/CyaY-like superfamily)
MKEGDISFHAKTRHQWRKWLERNHQKEKKVWLIIYHKDSDTKSIYYAEAVEEALCFGWIDSAPRKRDAESFFLSFSPRKPKSVWSKLNKERAARLISGGMMTPAGMEKIILAKKTGAWNALDKIDNMIIPDDLQKALSGNKSAMKNFSAFPPSAKKIILMWIDNARKMETRMNRVEETIRLAAKNIRANQYKPEPARSKVGKVRKSISQGFKEESPKNSAGQKGPSSELR